MADESVRSLLATLGFEVDNTEADQFEARFKKLEETVGTIAKRIDKFKPKFDGKKGESLGKKFGERIKKGVKKGLKIDPDKGFPGFTKSLKTGLGKAFKAAKLVAIAGAAALVATVGKGILKFTDVDIAKFALRFQAENLGVDFDKILVKLEDVKAKTKGVVDELDILQALDVGFQLTNNMEDVAENMEDVVKFASVLNKDASEIQRIISTFIISGETTGLRALGLITQQQREAMRRAGTGFETLSEAARTEIIKKGLAEQIDRLNKKFKEFSGTNTAFIAKMKVLASEGLVDVGEAVTKGIRKTAEFFGITEETPRELTKKIKIPPNNVRVIDPDSPSAIRRREERKARLANETTINQTNTVNVNGGDTEAVRKVVGEVIKDAAQIELRKIPDKALPVRGE